MDEREFENTLQRLLKRDFSEGTEGFREKLLAHCLQLIGSDEESAEDDEIVIELSENELDMLAAAGDLGAQMENGAEGGYRTAT